MNKAYIEKRIAQIIVELSELTTDDLRVVLYILQLLEPKDDRDFLMANITRLIPACTQQQTFINMWDMLIARKALQRIREAENHV